MGTSSKKNNEVHIWGKLWRTLSQNLKNEKKLNWQRTHSVPVRIGLACVKPQGRKEYGGFNDKTNIYWLTVMFPGLF